jgi:glycosyltransferase involved in cell wall biosynthesis
LGGGTQHMTQMLANALCHQPELRIFVLGKSGDHSVFYPLDEAITYSILDNAPYRQVISWLKDVWLLSQYVRRHDIHILVNVDVSLGTFSLPLKGLHPRLKQVFWDHFHSGYNGACKRMESLRKQALHHGNAYVTLTPQDVDALKERHAPRTRLLSIPNIVPYAVSSLPYASDSKTLVTVGNMLPEKGFDLAVEAAAIVFKAHPDWRWEFYGNGTEQRRLRAQVARLGLKQNIRFMGRVPDLAEAYRRAALYVLPSRTEGFGLVLAEAKAFNLPVVAFDVPYGPRNLIQDGVNGLLVQPLDTQGLANAILALIENPARRLAFSQKAAMGLEELSTSRVAARWSDLFKEIA